MKYIIFSDFAGKETPVIFPERIMHEEMREQIPYAEVLAAGYVYLRDGAFHCRGESKELGAGARSEDSRVMARFFAPQGEGRPDL